MSLKTAMWCLSPLLAAALFTIWPQTVLAQESQCISCHTSGGKLIKITRDLATHKMVPDVKSKGPG